MLKKDTLKVMIVDDEYIVREDIKTIMAWEDHGYTITGEASNGKQACGLFRQDPCDLIIADIQMPFMNGLEMAAQIKEMDKRVRFIFLTAYSDFEFLRTAMRMGIHSYILKHEMEEKVLLKELDLLREELKAFGACDEKEEDLPSKHNGDKFEKIRSYIEQNYNQDIALGDLAAKFQLTEAYLSHQFKVETGISMKSYIKQLRMEKAKKYLVSGRYKINDISRKVGYSSIQYFYLVFKQYFGITPAELLKEESQDEE